jgi:ABC-type dipeptide/oligopeptide/nickel transport system permease component
LQKKQISENSTVILCPIRVNQVVASYGKSDSISGSVEFNILIEIDSNERILDIQTNSLKFLEENPGKYFNWLSNIGKTIEKEVKKEVATTVGVAVGNAVKVAVTGLTANPVLGVAAGIVAGVIVKDQVEKKLNN